jgi:hypothetical protein
MPPEAGVRRPIFLSGLKSRRLCAGDTRIVIELRLNTLRDFLANDSRRSRFAWLRSHTTFTPF